MILDGTVLHGAEAARTLPRNVQALRVVDRLLMTAGRKRKPDTQRVILVTPVVAQTPLFFGRPRKDRNTKLSFGSVRTAHKHTRSGLSPQGPWESLFHSAPRPCWLP